MIIGVDQSPTNMGVAAVDEDTYRLVVSYRYDLTGVGWLHTRVRDYLYHFIHHAGKGALVTGWVREQPIARSMGIANRHGYTAACVDQALCALIPHARHLAHWTTSRGDPTPGEWKKAVGLKGNAKADVYVPYARDLEPRLNDASEDECAAYLIARAAAQHG